MGWALASVVLLQMAQATALTAGGTFWDDDRSVHEPAIEAIAEAHITEGCAEPDLFCPQRPVTRGQMAAFLARSLSLPPGSDAGFGDIDDSIFARDIEALAAASITRGCEPRRFCPDTSVTRGQLAAFLTRAFGYGPGPDAFTDDDHTIFEDDIDALAAAGVTTGCSDGRFCPDRAVTRAEMASFLARALGLQPIAVAPRPTVTLGFGGDILIHPSVSRTAEDHGDPYDFRPMFDSVRPLVSQSDLAVCHLEVPLAADNHPLSGYPLFSAPRQVADAIAHAGFDGCSTASNHSIDQGERGVVETLEVLADSGLGWAGTAATEREAGRATLYDVGEVRIAHLAGTWWLNGLRPPEDKEWLVQMLDVEDLVRQGESARANGADIVVVSMHCCVEYERLPTSYQRLTARRLIESPHIDLVVGHHAHVVQPIERVGDEVILHGLGNFLSGQRLRPATQDGVYLEVEFGKRGSRWSARTVTAIPTWVAHTFRILPAAAHNRASWRRTAEALRLFAPDAVIVR